MSVYLRFSVCLLSMFGIFITSDLLAKQQTNTKKEEKITTEFEYSKYHGHNNHAEDSYLFSLANNSIKEISEQQNRYMVVSSAESSINKNINLILDKHIFAGLRKYDASTAIGLIMNANTGEVLSYSYFENREFSSQSENENSNYISKLSNYLFQNTSVMKLLTIAKSLDEGVVDISTEIDAEKKFNYGEYEIHDSSGRKKKLSIPEIFIYSSNIATARLVQRGGWRNAYAFYDKILFSAATHDGFGFLAPVIKPDKPSEFNTILASICFNIYATPLHYAAAVGSVVNGGIKIDPIYKKINHKPPNEIVFKHNKTSQYVLKILEKNVVSGMAKDAHVKGYSIGGMTSTSEKIINNDYNSKRVVSSFIGVVPSHKPNYVFVIIYDEPKFQSHHDDYISAAHNAAPTAAKIIEEIAPLLNIRKSN